MKALVHICLADAIEPHEPQIALPGGLVMLVFTVVDPIAAAAEGDAGSATSLVPGRRWHRELPEPGLTFEAYSRDQLVAIIRRELEGPQWLM